MSDRSKTSPRSSATPPGADRCGGGRTAQAASPAARIALSGFSTTAVTFGPARSAFGLFVPEFRAAFGLGSATVGLIAALGYLGFLVGLVVAVTTARRRATIVGGGAAAAAGMITVATASHAAVLAVGVFAAASSAGATWTPFNAITERTVPADRSDSTLAIVSTGTAFGLAGTGLVAAIVVAGDLAWRHAWWAFAVAGALVVVVDLVSLPTSASEHTVASRLRALRHSASFDGSPRLLTAGFAAGAGSSVWLAFAVDSVVTAGGTGGFGDGLIGPAMFVTVGLCGLVALGTGRLIRRWTLAATTRASSTAMAVSLILVGAIPSALPAALGSAAAFGVGLMITSACLASASFRLHHARPVEGFTTVLLSLAAGSISATAAIGVIADLFGLRAGLILLGSVLVAVSFAVTAPVRSPWQLPVPE